MPADSTALALLIACPVAWAAFDVVRKALASVGRATAVTFAIALLQLPVVLMWAAWVGIDVPPAAYWLPGLGALGVGILGTLAFQQAVQLSPLSATVPLLALTPVFASVLGVFVLDEVPAARQWLGIAITVAGALLVNAGARSRPWTLVRDLLREPGSPYMIGAALLFSLAPLFDKRALRHVPLPVHALIVIAGVVLVLGCRLVMRGRLAELRGLAARPGLAAAGGITSLLAFALQLAAVQVVWVGLLETAKRALGAAAALILGALVFGERVGPLRVLAVALLAVGVALVVT